MEKNAEISVIGGTRGMGEWFAGFLRKEGHAVRVCGRNVDAPAIREMAQTCDVAVISVPMRATREVIEKVGPHMRKDSLLMDLTSLKKESVTAMLETSVSEVIGCHPLFGPKTGSLSGQSVVLCPARSMRWISWLAGMMRRNGMTVVETTPERHDGMMALIQGLNHFNTIIMGLVLSEAGVSAEELMKFSTPAFRGKIEIMARTFCQNPALYADILTMNPENERLIDAYERNVGILKTMMRERDATRVTDAIEKHAPLFRDIFK